MRPLELLSKIEESAGTALYETRRKETVSALNKKDIKLKEIDYLLEKQIQPDLEKIKKDEVNNKKMAALTEEMDKFATFSEIFKYIQLDEDLKNGDSDLAKNQASIED
jgi:structural maintenance of chromosome 2